MPYTAYTKMSRDDVLAIRAYLNTVPPVRNAVVANTLPFPFNIRASMRVWNALYFKKGEYRLNIQRSIEWNRGAFLVDGPGHCGACHTPKTFLGGDKADQYLRGGFLQGWSAPDITGDARVGVGAWSARSVATKAQPTAAGMPSFGRQLDDAQIAAVLTYMRNKGGAAAPVAETQVRQVRSDTGLRPD
jgi:mono/diheme cytochrome c family protein